MRRSAVVFGLMLLKFAYANHQEENVTDFQALTWKFPEVQMPFMITMWLVVAALFKIFFDVLKPISNVFPDSSLLIAVGLLIGVIIRYAGFDVPLSLDSHAFFLYLLPPIIFDAGYFMPNRALFENFDSVMLFAVIGTIWNTMSIGLSLLLLSHFEMFSMDFDTYEIFVFSALISAVDPVAVIAVFEEINVNEFLFINVFGEALFNDGVTVVLYQMFKSFATVGSENLTTADYIKGGGSFFVVALGGALIGLIFAFTTAFLTKYTYHVRILAPVFIFVIPYLGYLTAESCSLSAILAIAICGMTMKQYVKGNITQSAANSVKYFTKMLSQSTETVIFMFLGLSTISSEHYWDWSFVIATVFFCILFRTIGVIVQCFLLNKFRGKQFTMVDQFVLCYGGLRGAIAFGLAISMSDSIRAKPMFVTTTIVVIFFTVFVQGITIRPLVEFLNVETKDIRQPTMAEIVYNKYLDYMMSGIEDIAGQKGQYTFIENFERFNAKVFKPILMRNEKKRDFDATKIVRAYEKITLEDALSVARATRVESSRSLKELAERKNAAAFRNDPAKKVSILESSEDVEALYTLFNDLLDKKLKELNLTKDEENSRNFAEEDDIHDDYLIRMHVGSHSNLNAVRPSELNLNHRQSIVDRRRSAAHIL